MKTLPILLQIRLEQFLRNYLVGDNPPCNCSLCTSARTLLRDIEAENEATVD